MSKTDKFNYNDNKEAVYCTACSYGPCIIAYYASRPEPMPDSFEFNKKDPEFRIPLECPLD